MLTRFLSLSVPRNWALRPATYNRLFSFQYYNSRHVFTPSLKNGLAADGSAAFPTHCSAPARSCSGWTAPRSREMRGDSRQESSSRRSQSDQSPKSIQDYFYELDMSVRRNGRIFMRDLENILAVIDSRSSSLEQNPLTSNQVLFLIRCTGSLLSEEPPAKRRQLSHAVWDKYSDQRVDISHYNALLKAMNENEEPFDGTQMLDDIKQRNLSPNRVTYQRVLHRCCQEGDMEKASSLLETMKTNSMTISEPVFASLILGYGRARDLESARGTLEVMRSSGLEPTSVAYTALAAVYAESNDIQRVLQTFDEATQAEAPLADHQILEVVKSLAKSSSEPSSSSIDDVLGRLNKDYGYNTEALRTIQDLINDSKLEAAIQVFKTMYANPENKSHGLFFVRQMVRAGTPADKTLAICDQLQNHGLLAGSYANVLAHESLQSADRLTAHTYLARMSETEAIKCHFFWPLIVRSQSEEELLNVITQDMTLIKQSPYAPMHETFRDWIWPKFTGNISDFMAKCKSAGYTYSLLLTSYVDFQLSNNQMRAAVEILESDQFDGVRLVSGLVHRTLMLAFINSQDADGAAIVLKHINRRSEKSDPPVDTVGRFLSLLAIYAPEKFPTSLQSLAPHLKSNELFMTTSTMESILERLNLAEKDIETLRSISVDQLDTASDDEEADSSSRMLSKMDYTELEARLPDLRESSTERAAVQRQLFIKYCSLVRRSDLTPEEKDKMRSRMFELADILQQIASFGPSLQSRLMDHYSVVERDHEKALQIRKSMSSDFLLDSRKIINLAECMIKGGTLDEALNFINEEISRRSRFRSSVADDEPEYDKVSVSVNRQFLDRNINKIINSVMEITNDPARCKEIVDLIQKLTDLKPSALWFSPIIRQLYAAGEVDKAMEEFDDIYRSHRITPYKSELMRELVQNSDAKRLQQVIDSSTAIYGEISTLLDLSVACVEAGKLKQARKVLETPGMRARNDRIVSICEKLCQNDSEEHLINFIAITKDLFDINRDRMYCELIRLYARRKDGQKALNIWTNMQEEDLQPSEKTLHLLGNLLQETGIPVPFIVPSASEAFNSAPPVPETRTSRIISSRKEFSQAIRDGSLDAALAIKSDLERLGEGLSLSQHSLLLDGLTKADRLEEAFALLHSLVKENFYPSPRVIRFVISRLSQTGDIEKLQKIFPLLPANFTENGFYSNIITNGYINAGRGQEFVDSILPTMKPLPAGGLLAILEKVPGVESKIHDLARAQEQEGNHLPLNMLWLHYMHHENYAEAEALFSSSEKLRSRAMFNTLVKKIREKSDHQLGESLARQMKMSSMNPRAIGFAYSAVVDALVDSGRLDEAEAFLLSNVSLQSSSAPGGRPSLGGESVSLVDLNRRALVRLKNGIEAQLSREAKFEIPEVSPSSEESSSSSSPMNENAQLGGMGSEDSETTTTPTEIKA